MTSPRISTRDLPAISGTDWRDTAFRLGIASLGYLVVMTLVVTLTPFRFAARPAHGITWEWTVVDLVMNVVMFVPLGFLYALAARGSTSTITRALIAGAAFSALIETSQLFEAERYTSLLDVATNAIGAGSGALLHRLLSRRSTSATVHGGVRALALELPLMGLLYLLVPLTWLIGLGSGTGPRLWLLVPIGIFGGALIGAVHGSFIIAVRWRAIAGLFAVVSVWASIASIMAARRMWTAGAFMLGAALIAALWQRERVIHARKSNPEQRFEGSTLRSVLPTFAMYLAIAALWPLDGADLQWRAGVHFFPAGTMAVDVAVYRALEHIAAFTLTGYIIAEVQGRSDRSYRIVVRSVATWGCTLALLLETARGVHPLYGFSAILFVLACCAAVFGGWMYHLQRDHVRALNTAARLESARARAEFFESRAAKAA